MPATKRPTFSLIIPAHNEAFALPACLESAFAAGRATGAAFEVIVVDDASTDRTAAIARAAGAVVVSVSLRQIAGVRNAGAKVAAGDVLVFLDADTCLPAATLAAALAALRGGAVGGGCMVRFDRAVGLPVRLFIAVFVLIYMRLCRWAAGCFIFARRDAFAAVGGFDERYYASEEVHLSKALKRRGRFVMLRQHVITSARKIRQYTHRQKLGLVARYLWHGDRMLQQREGLDLWYEGKREDAETR